MDKETIRQCGDELYDAWLARQVLSPLLERAPDISLANAQAVQSRLVNRRGQAGETIIGKKIGAVKPHSIGPSTNVLGSPSNYELLLTRHTSQDRHSPPPVSG